MSKSNAATTATKAPRTRKAKATPAVEAPLLVAPPVAATPAPVATATETGRKIEKDRPKQNGVTRPSAGGACRAVWDLCDALGDASNPPTIAAVKAAAPPTLNATNVQIEYYQWRKYHGVRGRIKATPAPQEA